MKLKVKFVNARGAHAAGAVAELEGDELSQALEAGDALPTRAAANVEATTNRLKEFETNTTKANEAAIKAAVQRARDRGAIPAKDTDVEATALSRLGRGNDVDLLVQVIDGMAGTAQQQAVDASRLAMRHTPGASVGDPANANSRIILQGVSVKEAVKAYVTQREPMDKLIRGGRWKDASAIAAETAAIAFEHITSVVRNGGDFHLGQMVKAADFSDPDSQLGTLSTGLLLMRNLGFLRAKLAWLPYLSTDLSAEPAKFKQPILTRYITPPNLLTYIPGVGYTSDAGTIAANAANETETSGTKTQSVPSTTDKSVTMDTNKGVEIEIAQQRLSSTMRNLFAEQYSAQLYTIAEAVNKAVMTKMFTSNWSGVKTVFKESFATMDIKSMVRLKSYLGISKVPDVGRFALLHTFMHDILLQDTNLLSAKAILALINKDQSAFESGELPALFGVKPLESQLCSATDAGVLTDWSDETNPNTTNIVGFAGNMSSMLFVSRPPQDYTSVAGALGVPATAAVEIVTDPDSGLSMMVVRYTDHGKASVICRCALMWGVDQGDPRVGFPIKLQ